MSFELQARIRAMHERIVTLEAIAERFLTLEKLLSDSPEFKPEPPPEKRGPGRPKTVHQ